MAETYEVPSGAVNGVNTVFTTTTAEYDAGSLVVWHNGSLLEPVDVTETDPATGIFTLGFAPANTPGDPDFLMVRYLTDEVGITVVVTQKIDVVVTPVVPATISVTVSVC